MKAWINLYGTGLHGNIGHAYRTREQADMFAHPARIACVPVSFAVGDGIVRPATSSDDEWERAAPASRSIQEAAE